MLKKALRGGSFEPFLIGVLVLDMSKRRKAFLKKP